MNTYDVDEAIQAQQEYRKEYAEKHPRDWASSMIKRGEGFAPWMNAVTAANDHSNPTKSKQGGRKKKESALKEHAQN